MSHDLTTRLVAKPRLIAALMAELDASGAVILAECLDDGAVFHKPIQCEFKVPFEDSFVCLDTQGHLAKQLRCVCCFGGQRISFDLVKESHGNFDTNPFSESS